MEKSLRIFANKNALLYGSEQELLSTLVVFMVSQDSKTFLIDNCVCQR